MVVCPITLTPVDGGGAYSVSGLREIHLKLTELRPLALTHAEQLKQSRLRSDKMSIQGVQPKLSAVLSLQAQAFSIVDRGGKFILKPNPPQFEEVPENEALTMRMAHVAGIEAAPHGLVRAMDGGWVYFTKRFDREGRSGRVHVEDFAQLSNETRETKYDSSLERVARVVDTYCTFPVLERPKLAARLLFAFLTGNEDMHLKNFSLRERDGIVALSPAYDLLNTTLVLENAREESALPLKGKKKQLSRKLWIDYFCRERLELPERQVQAILGRFRVATAVWIRLIQVSYLSTPKKGRYLEMLKERCRRLGIDIPQA
jgi:serine/threonine-protein kinase HipA